MDDSTVTDLEKELSILSLENELRSLACNKTDEFDLFDSFGVSDETQVSSILAYLFNYNGQLSIENGFLQAFLQRFLNDDELSRKKFNITLEVDVYDRDADASRRPDIVLEAENHVIFIENKIRHSAIRQNQIIETCKFIANKRHWQEKKKIYVFLAPSNSFDEKTLAELGASKNYVDRIIHIKWSEIADFLETQAMMVQRGSKLWYVLFDFRLFTNKIDG